MKAEKPGLHPRNPHRFNYDFHSLSETLPELKSFLGVNKFGNLSIDFANPKAVLALNKALLRKFYGIEFWEIPEDFLCPPIPGRADYIHYLADLLGLAGETVRVLDIGTGANCIYPLIGHKAYGWSFVGSEINPTALASAKKIVKENKLDKVIELRLQDSSRHIFKGIIKAGESFAACLCNPPFHASAAEAQAGSHRKWKNLGKKVKHLNFGGKSNELWCEGGEEAFILQMIKESSQMPEACRWFTTLVSKEASLPALYRALKAQKASEIKTIEMSQGQKISRILAWQFKT